MFATLVVLHSLLLLLLWVILSEQILHPAFITGN
jgi:hypothetical protein